jgi:hypothetical protein
MLGERRPLEQHHTNLLLRCCESPLSDEVRDFLGVESASLAKIHCDAERVLDDGRNQYVFENGDGVDHVEEWVRDRFSDEWASFHFENWGLQNFYAQLLMPHFITSDRRNDHWQFARPKPDKLDIASDFFSYFSKQSVDRRKEELATGAQALVSSVDQNFSAAPDRKYWTEVGQSLLEWFSLTRILMMMSWPVFRGESGFPDLLCFDGESPFFAEIKADGDTLRDEQEECLEFLTKRVGVPCKLVFVEDRNAGTDEYRAFFKRKKRERSQRRKRRRDLWQNIARLRNWTFETRLTKQKLFDKIDADHFPKFPETTSPQDLRDLASEADELNDSYLASTLRRWADDLEQTRRYAQERLERQRETEEQLEEQERRARPFKAPYSEGKRLEKEEGDLEAAIEKYEKALVRFEEGKLGDDIGLQWLLASLANRYSITLKKLKRYSGGIDVIDRAEALLPDDFNSSKWESTVKRREWFRDRCA